MAQEKEGFQQMQKRHLSSDYIKVVVNMDEENCYSRYHRGKSRSADNIKLENNLGDVRRFSASNDSMSMQPPPIQRRKFSFPATLHHNLLGLPETYHTTARRRLSNVSDAVSRKFSHTIGWRSSSVPTADIVAQGKTLCGQYIRCRLKRSNMFNRKYGLQRLRSAASLPGNYVVREVFPELLSIGQELERLHPELYTGVGRQASSTPVLATEKAVNTVVTGVAHELSNSGITWAKIVSLYAVAGGLAVDCVRQGHPEFLPSLVESLGEALDDDMAEWIAHNGGWTGLLVYCKPPSNEISLSGFISMLAAAMFMFLFIVILLRWFGKFNYF